MRKLLAGLLSLPLASAAAPAPKQTPGATGLVINKRHFSLELPADWRERPAHDGFDFVNERLGLQLTVSVLEARRLLDPEELQAALERLVEVRKQVLQELSAGHVEIAAEHSSATAVPVTATLSGVDTKNQVCFTVNFFGYPAKMITAMYLQYGCSSPASVRDDAAHVLRFLSVAGV